MFLINPYRFASSGGGSGTGQAHRYWRLQINSVVSGTEAFVRRLAFLETLDSSEIVNTGGTASASVDNGDAALAFTDSSAAWNPSGVTFPVWIAYDLGSAQVCAAIRYYGSDFSGLNNVHPTDFDVQWSDDGSAWTTEWSSTYLQGYGETWYVGNPHFEQDITNNSFEDGDLTGWTTDSGTVSVGTADDGANGPYRGTYLAHIATGVGDSQISQDIDVSSLATEIDTGPLAYLLSVAELQWASTDTANLTAVFLDGSDVELASYSVSNNTEIDDWEQIVLSGTLPPSTRTVRIELLGTDTSGGSTATISFDEARLFLQDKDLGLFPGTVYQSNFEGPDATNISGTGPDDTGYNHSHSFGGIRGVEFSTTEAKFGSASANSDGGSNSFLRVVTQGDEFKFGTGDFSIEFFILQDAADAGFILGQWNNGSNRRAWTIAMETNGSIQFYFTASGSTSTSAFGGGTSAGVLTQDGTWQHVAICRVSGVMSLYVDGTRLQTATVTTDLFEVDDDFIMFNAGENQYNQPWAGYLDGVRIIKGNSPYDPTSASITVPTSYYS